MTTHVTTKVESSRFRQLYYGEIRLIPVDNGVYPYCRETFKDSWHVPGWRRYGTTDELVKLASKRGITVRLTETSSDGQTTIRLN